MSDKPAQKKSLIRRIFGGLWSLISNLYRAVIIIAFCAFLYALYMAFTGGPAKHVDSNVALVLWPSGALVDQLDSDPGQRLLQQVNGDPPSQTRLQDLTEALEAAATDDRITVAVLKLDDLTSASMPQLEELGAAMKKFRASNKPIYAYGPSYDQIGYFAAAQADDVSMDPFGSIMLEGLGSYQNYFKDGLDKLGVTINVFRVGEYKSAVEPFLRNDMSEDAKAANKEWLSDLWKSYDDTVSSSRKLEAGFADKYVNTFGKELTAHQGDAAKLALDAGLVNHLETLSEFRKRVAEKVGEDDDKGSFRQIHFHDYLSAVHREKRQHEAHGDKSEVAMIAVQGEIVDGAGQTGQAGGESISELLDQARRDDHVAAVVLRVDSPGGSVWASEQIRRGVQELRADGKPVVVSMSGVAASGGYWVSMASDRIFAHESTITGSIGIFGLIPTIDKPLEKLGIHTDGVGTTPLAGAFRMDRPLSDDVKVIVQSQIDHGYRQFIEGVAAGRKLDVKRVDEIARGRVWSGHDAKDLGLVDEFGGLEDAADAAAKLAGLTEGQWHLSPFENAPSGPLSIVSSFFGATHITLNWLPFGGNAKLQQWLKQGDATRALSVMTDRRAMYALCFCEPTLSSSAAPR
jgi:protease-4